MNVNTIGFMAYEQEDFKEISALPTVGDNVRLTVGAAVYNLVAYAAEEYMELPEGSIAACSSAPSEDDEPDQFVYLVPPVEDYLEFNSLAQIALNGEHFDDDEYVEIRHVTIEIV